RGSSGTESGPRSSAGHPLLRGPRSSSSSTRSSTRSSSTEGDRVERDFSRLPRTAGSSLRQADRNVGAPSLLRLWLGASGGSSESPARVAGNYRAEGRAPELGRRIGRRTGAPP